MQANGFTRIVGALVATPAVLMAAIVCGGAAGADPNQDEQFVGLLQENQIPAVDNVPGLVYRAHEICGELDDGVSFDAVLDEEMDIMQGDSARVHTTATRFISASVQVYCPGHSGQVP